MACYYLYLRINGLIVMTKIILVAQKVNSIIQKQVSNYLNCMLFFQ